MLRKIFISIVVFFLLTSAMWLVTKIFLQTKLKEFQEKNTLIIVSEAKIHFLGLEAKTVSFIRPPLRIDGVTCSVPLGSIISFQPYLDCLGTFLEGKVSFVAKGLFNTEINAEIEDANIVSYPLANLLGIVAGKSTIQLHKVLLNRQFKPTSGTLELSIEKLKLPKGYTLNPPLVPLAIHVPKIDTADIRILAELKDDVLVFQEVLVASSLGSLEASGQINQVTSLHPQILIPLQINLNQEGVKSLGPWLQLLRPSADGRIESNYNISLEGNLKMPRVIVSK